MEERGEPVLEFSAPDAAQRWVRVNDGVMGGLSQSTISFTSSGTMVFEGNVSLENNGGFASVRTRPYDYQLGGFRGLVLGVTGDGRHYQLRLRTDASFDGVAYQAGFDTAPGTPITVRISFSECRPTFRGRPVPGAPTLDSARIRQIGFLIADRQVGPFQLEIEWLGAYR